MIYHCLVLYLNQSFISFGILKVSVIKKEISVNNLLQNARRSRREEAKLDSDRTSKRLLSTLLKQHAVRAVTGKTPAVARPGPSTTTGDMFELPLLPEPDRPL